MTLHEQLVAAIVVATVTLAVNTLLSSKTLGTIRRTIDRRRPRRVQDRADWVTASHTYADVSMSRAPLTDTLGRKRTRLRHVDVDQLVEDYGTDMTVNAICRQHRIGLSTLYRILDARGVARRRPNAYGTATRLEEQIAADYRDGTPVNEIARRHGVSPSTVSNIAHRRHNPPRTIVRHRDELINLATAWLTGSHDLDPDQRSALRRIGLSTRIPGLRALDHIDPELQPAIAAAVIDEMHRRWPPR